MNKNVIVTLVEHPIATVIVAGALGNLLSTVIKACKGTEKVSPACIIEITKKAENTDEKETPATEAN